MLSNKKDNLHNNSSAHQKKAREALYQLFKNRPFDDECLLTNLGIFARSSALAKIFFLHEIYGYIVNLPGDIYVYGVWLGQDLVVFESLRAMLEPYHARKIVGFDTFDGYTNISNLDKKSNVIKEKGYSTIAGYEDYLKKVIEYHKAENVIGHLLKHELIKGDVTKTSPSFVKNHPESIVALAYFDLALYKPTLVALKSISERLVPGSLVVFDQLNDPRYPGESIAFFKWIKKFKYEIKRSKILPDRTFVIINS